MEISQEKSLAINGQVTQNDEELGLTKGHL
jgi:hypothetical protein